MKLYLCPFCDEPLSPRREDWFRSLPTTTLHTLPQLIARLWHLSEPEKRPSNRYGRRVPHTQSDLEDVVCGHHRYEVGSLPLFIQYRWPSRMDYNTFLIRLRQPSVLRRLLFVFSKPWCAFAVSENAVDENRPVTRAGSMSQSRKYSVLHARLNQGRGETRSAA